MQKNSVFLIVLFFSVIAGNLMVNGQGSTDVRQVIIANGGKFESVPPFSDYVTVESYDPATHLVNVFNTIHTQSVQDVLIKGDTAYVAAQDSVVMYNLNTYQRMMAVLDSGVNKMAIYGNNLIITKQYPIVTYKVEIRSASDLGLFHLITGIPGDCEGVTVYNSMIYVAVDSGYLGLNGRLAVIDPSSWTVSNIYNLGPSAIGINSLYPYGGYIYCVNKTPYGSGNVGSVTQFNPTYGTFVTNVLGINVGPGYGIAANLLYMGMNFGIGSYNLDTQSIADTTIIANPGSGTNGIVISSVGVDYINDRFYLNLGNRSSFGVGFVANFNGDSLSSYTTGLNADACAIDFRTPTGVSNTTSREDGVSIYPNPVNDHLMIHLNGKTTLNEINILDLTGRSILTREVQKSEKTIRIDIPGYPSGVYMISFRTDQGSMVRKFIKR
jgi:hypothetical protein